MWYTDPSVFEDQIATETSWNAMPDTHSILHHKRLLEIDDNTLIYGITPVRRVVGFVSVFLGLIAFALFSVESNISTGVILLMLSVAAGTLGFLLVLKNSTPIIFDGNEERVYWGRGDEQISKRFSDIHAIQHIPNLFTGTKNGTWYECQLNIVMKDGSRINLTNNSNFKKTDSEIEKLKTLLDVKVWDTTDRY